MNGEACGRREFLQGWCFFTWTATKGDSYPWYFEKAEYLLVNWCCLCQCSEESVDHSLIHCTQVSSLCSLVFFLFGVSWVIPKHMVELLACWKGGFGCYLAADIWWAIPLCLMWTIWREQNLCTFEEKKHSILNLKRFFSFSLCDWMSVRSDPLFSSHVDFLDLCSLDDLSRLL